jgi:hypothetical protein
VGRREGLQGVASCGLRVTRRGEDHKEPTPPGRGACFRMRRFRAGRRAGRRAALRKMLRAGPPGGAAGETADGTAGPSPPGDARSAARRPGACRPAESRLRPAGLGPRNLPRRPPRQPTEPCAVCGRVPINGALAVAACQRTDCRSRPRTGALAVGGRSRRPWADQWVRPIGRTVTCRVPQPELSRVDSPTWSHFGGEEPTGAIFGVGLTAPGWPPRRR